MDRLEVSMCLIDQEIDNLVSKKNLIDIRLNELYQQREDLVTEWNTQLVRVTRSQKDSYKDKEDVMTRKEADELYKELSSDAKWQFID